MKTSEKILSDWSKTFRSSVAITEKSNLLRSSWRRGDLVKRTVRAVHAVQVPRGPAFTG